ncbi:MAG TPA: family 10 glycosylhydrolase, partial [Lacipirellulaceae bacterium]|nr:family 10 glycosylhydrolase [Lacipirellulaceae bacterium]
MDPTGPPPVAREFRGAWVATVGNIDWPSKPGLPADVQKRELIAIFDKCLELNLNGVIFQVRTQADALYDSKFEPWSEFLTGRMGEAPKPYYDPLKFAVEEAHRRGLQLHAWFNPYRVHTPVAKSEPAANHASVARPDIVRTYGQYKWFDPGDPASEDAFVAVLTDVVKRYDVDGVHIDDYFYPYQEKDKSGKTIPFPDDETYRRAVAAGVKLDRADWRRQNVNHLIERMYTEVKKLKPWVLVGISPFGIW